MTVLHIVEAFGGGVLTYFQSLINGMEDCQSVILYAMRPGTPKDFETMFCKQTRFIHSQWLTRELNMNHDIKAFLEIRRVVRQVKPDVVHLHSSKAGVLGRWALNGRKVPLFYTPNGYSFLMRGSGSRKRMLYWLIEKMSGFRPCKTIACGKGEYEYALHVTHDAAYVNNGINTKDIDALELDLDRHGQSLTVCTLARVTAQKNPQMFNQIAERMPDVHFVWIGDGELRSVLTSPNIEVTGWLSKEKALREMAKYDVFLLPSLWEGLSLSLIEAMYLKRVCVVSDISSNRDAVENGVSGYVCSGLEDYVNTLEEIKRNGVNQWMVQNAKKRVEQFFTQRVMAEAYQDIYNDALENMRGGGNRKLVASIACSYKLSFAPLSHTAEGAVA